MTTALQLVNDVLVGVRENEVTDFSAAYTKLILKFVNETKREVEDAWNWTMLRTTKDITTASGTRQYALTGAGNRYKVLRDYNGRDMVWDITNKSQLSNSNTGVIALDSLTNPLGRPMHYRFFGQDNNGDPYVDLSSIPDGTYTIRFYMVVPQAKLVNTTDTLTVPESPVVLGATARAIRERGEDEGLATSEVFEFFRQALADEVSKDESRTIGETDWNG